MVEAGERHPQPRRASRCPILVSQTRMMDGVDADEGVCGTPMDWTLPEYITPERSTARKTFQGPDSNARPAKACDLSHLGRLKVILVES